MMYGAGSDGDESNGIGGGVWSIARANSEWHETKGSG